MAGAARPLAATLVAVAALTGCIPGIGDCAMAPLGALPIAAIAPPKGPGLGPPATSCASMVDFGGRRYFRSGDARSWTVQIDDLEPIGAASAANETAWEDATVFAISGVDPEDAIAMRYGSGVTIAVLLAGNVSSSLCRYLSAPDIEPVCRDG